MTIGTVLKKDLLTYSRHKKTLLLIFIAPVLIMILIGSVFSGADDKGLTNVKLGVGGDLEYGNQMIEDLNNSNMFILIMEDTNDSEVIKEGVRRGKYSAGIFIPGNENETLRLYLDNSRVQIAPIISTVFITTTEKMSYELTFGFISKLWTNLGVMESQLIPLKDGILLINGSISDLNRSTQNVLVSMDSINVSNLNESVAIMKHTMELMQKDLNRTAFDISVTQAEIHELDRNVTSIYEDSTELRDDLKFVIDSIDSADVSLLSIQTTLEATYDSTCVNPENAQCVSLANTIQQIKDSRALLLERTGHIRSLYNNLANVAQTSSQLHEKLNLTELRLQSMQESITNYDGEISNIYGNITDIESAIYTLGEVNNQSKGVSIQMNGLASELAKSTASLASDIDQTKNVLDEVISTSPGFIAAPVKLEKESVFIGRSYLDFLMPGIISIVLMFISFLLASITIVQERSKKTLIRTLLTPISLEGFLFEKTAALILIAFLQGFILIVIAYLFYGIVIPTGQLGELFLVILVYSGAFIGIGMALATFAESENTAMLLSLVLSIPMLFLSGVFFPFETMPQLMVNLSSALPITMGIKALESVLIYQEGFDMLAGYLMPLIMYGVAGIGLAYVLLRKEIMD